MFPGVAVKLIDRLWRARWRRVALENRRVRFENILDEFLPQFLTDDLLAFQQIQDDLLAGLPNVVGLRHEAELGDFPEYEAPVDNEKQKFSKLRSVDVGSLVDAESALQWFS